MYQRLHNKLFVGKVMKNKVKIIILCLSLYPLLLSAEFGDLVKADYSRGAIL